MVTSRLPAPCFAIVLLAALALLPASGCRKEAADAGAPAAAPRPLAPASLPAPPPLDPVRAAAEVQSRLAELATVGDENRRLALLRDLTAAYRGFAAPALPLIAPLLADRSLRRRPDGSPTAPRYEALAMLQEIASDEAVALLIDATQEAIRAGENGELYRLFMALGGTRRHRAAVELCRILDEYQEQPGDVRDRIVDFFTAFPLGNWPAATLCAVVENTRQIWETLAVDPDPFGPALQAQGILDAQLATLVELLRQGGVSADDRAMALDMLRRISGRYLPDDYDRWRAWYMQNRR